MNACAEEMASREEIAASILAPHFCAVQDVFSEHKPEPSVSFRRLARVKFVIEPKIHDKPRHFAATREDGMLMYFAPEIVELPVETLVAILAHEFGHASDFVYPARFYMQPDGPGEANWICERDVDTKEFRAWSKVWGNRSADPIEWAADGIAQSVTGQKLTYKGDCLLQCFHGGIERPKGLR